MDWDWKDEVLTQAEVATMLGVSEKTLLQMRSGRDGPDYFKLSPGASGRVRYRRSAVERYIEDEKARSLSMMNREEAALAMGVTTQLLDRRRSTGEFPECIELGDGRYARLRYRRADVERFVAARRLPDSLPSARATISSKESYDKTHSVPTTTAQSCADQG
jgi:predicted DNA-binding transcriptional regulator AlpA